jgi:hypothetical protein
VFRRRGGGIPGRGCATGTASLRRCNKNGRIDAAGRRMGSGRGERIRTSGLYVPNVH